MRVIIVFIYLLTWLSKNKISDECLINLFIFKNYFFNNIFLKHFYFFKKGKQKFPSAIFSGLNSRSPNLSLHQSIQPSLLKTLLSISESKVSRSLLTQKHSISKGLSLGRSLSSRYCPNLYSLFTQSTFTLITIEIVTK